MREEKLPMLAAYGDTDLSPEAARQLAELSEDDNRAVHEGAPLPTVEKPPLLVAHRADALTAEAAEELVRMAEDQSVPTHEGKELPKADEAALLRKARQLQNA